MRNNNKKKISALMEGFESICRSKGLRLTHQRLEIFRELVSHPDHPTTENVFDRVRRKLKTISLDTVYRTIATFEEYGLIRRVKLLDNSTRFDVNLSVHHHLVCSRCKNIEDFIWPNFDRMKPPKTISHWGQIEVKHVVISGLCSNCKKKK
jgi:Fur family peroxide stress response transcriptional regulator